MALFVDQIRLRVATNDGLFGTDLDLARGLNVLRAENSSGKSTAIMAMVYALGLEKAFSAQSGPPLPPSVTDALEYRGRKIGVLESRVQVALSNGRGRQIEVVRDVKSTRDRRLVTVSEGATRMDYYVQAEGAAQRDRGFHSFLAEFVGWQLPNVPKYDGKDGLLYIECLLPFFVVEQKSGWSQIEPRLPTRFGIRDMHARAVEYLLNLDVQRTALLRSALRTRAEEARSRWNKTIATLAEVVRVAGGSLRGFPEAPVVLWPPSPDAEIVFAQGPNKALSLAEETATTVEKLLDLQKRPIPTVGEASEAAKSQLAEAENQFALIDSLYREAVNATESERAFNRSIEERLVQLDEDLRKYRDLKRLKEYGSTEGADSWSGSCPTCHQQVSDALLAPGAIIASMSIEENIAFIRAQIDAYKATKIGSDASLAEKSTRADAILAKGNELRGKIRALKDTLTSANNAPSYASVRELVLLEERKTLLEKLAAEVSSTREALAVLAREWGEIQAAFAEAREGASVNDTAKISAWTGSIREQLRQYGFTSVDSMGLDVSWGSFRLEFDGSAFERGISASDMVRCHWAYLLGLLEVGAKHASNHPLLLVFDEPRQQSAKDLSFGALLKRASGAVAGGRQMIIATSEKRETLRSLLEGVPHKLIDFGEEKLLSPIN